MCHCCCLFESSNSYQIGWPSTATCHDQQGSIRSPPPKSSIVRLLFSLLKPRETTLILRWEFAAEPCNGSSWRPSGTNKSPILLWNAWLYFMFTYAWLVLYKSNWKKKKRSHLGGKLFTISFSTTRRGPLGYVHGKGSHLHIAIDRFWLLLSIQLIDWQMLLWTKTHCLLLFALCQFLFGGVAMVVRCLIG